jgi:hypothetical protein
VASGAQMFSAQQHTQECLCHPPQVAQNLQLLPDFVGHVAVAGMQHGSYVVAVAASWLPAILFDIERGAL